MKSNIVITISLIIFVSLVGFVIAEISEDFGGQHDTYLNEGWNLVSIYAFSDIFYEGQSQQSIDSLKDKGIKAIYFYDRYNNKYIRLYPSHDNKRFEVESLLSNVGDVEEGGDIGEYGGFVNSVMWVYSKKSQPLDFYSVDGPINFDLVKLRRGWNFLVITPDMVDVKYGDIFSECNVLQMAGWKNNVQSWDIALNFNSIKDVKLFEGDVWEGLVVKVSDDCKLGNAVSPPELPPPGFPENGGIDPLSILIKSDIGDFTYSQTQFYERSLNEVVYEEHIAYYDLDDGTIQSDVNVRMLTSSADADKLWQEMLKSIIELNMTLENINGVLVYEGDDGVTITAKLSFWRSGNYIISVSEPKSKGEILKAYLNKYG